ncbi:cadherin-like domain-containing protein [Mycolicibacterium phlei]|uniref:cadherin-like domain-containing protein n=2 Tax=Mycolicibacterium phlei TaxID=1771 RepID=UPI0002F97A99|nr:cadherin-like domain-containing protein [Mycolicibacterium phlei]
MRGQRVDRTRGRHRRNNRTSAPQAVYPHFTLRPDDRDATAAFEPATAANYSRYIGRVGALAVALGIGAVVGTGHHGMAVAYAQPESGSDDAKVSDTSPSTTSESAESPSTPSSNNSGNAGTDTDTDPDTSGGMQVSSSGGLTNSTNDAGQATDDDLEVETPEPEPEPEEEEPEPVAGEDEAVPPIQDPEPESDPAAESGGDPASTENNSPAEAFRSPEPTSDTDVIDSVLQAFGLSATSEDSEDIGDTGNEAPNQVAHHIRWQPPTIPSATAVNPLQAVLAVPMAVIDLAHTVVAALLTPIFGHPSAPTHPPMLWAMLEFVRREVQRTFFNWTPIAINQEITLVLPPGGESGPISFHVHDFDGDNLRYYVPTQGVPGGPTHGSVTVDQATGTFTYTPDPGFTGTDEFRLTVSDAHTRPHLHGLLGFLRPHWGHTDSAKIRITVVAATLPPTPNNDVFVTEQGVPATGNVLANDTDPNGETLTAAPLVEPQYGRLTLQPDGSFLYEPDPEYSGEDVFLYTAYNSAAGAPARVAIIITPVNRPPVGTDDEYVITEDSQATGNVLANDSDPDGDSFTAVLDTAPSHGTVQLNADGSFVYTPNANFTGTDAFSYVATDGELTGAPTLVRITVTPVNDDPVANPDSYTVNEDAVLVGNVLANDVDVDGDPLTVTPGAGTANGQLQWHSNGSFTYTPNANFHGTDSFTYTVTDSHGATSGPATVTITVNPVNDAPVAVNDSFTVTEDGTLTNNVLTNDSDVDGDSLTASVVSNPAHGTLTLESDGSFTYKPNENYYGTDSFSYTVSDGTATSAPAVVTITVTPVNDAPVAQDDVYVVAEDGTLSGNLLTNDSDVDGNPLSVSTVTQPGHGTVAFNPDGSFTYTPAADFNGTDTFTYTVIDGKGGSDTGLVTVTVTPVNDAPVSQDDFYSTPEDSPLTGNVLDNDHDIDGDALTAVLVMPPSHGDVTLNEDGTFTYTPAPDFNGVDYFYYSVSDGVVDSDASIVIISVTPVNDPPVAQDDSYTINEDSVLTGNVLSNDTDKDNNPLTATLVSPAANGTVTLNADGTFTYIPNSGFHGEDSFTYIASDHAADSEVATVRITVRDINHAPVAANDTFTTNEDTPKTGSVLDNDTDSDGDPLTAQLVSGPSNGTLTLNPDGTFSYTPNANFHGVDSFTYKASDGLLTSNTATVTITVASVNDLPVAGPDSYTINEDSTLTGNVLGNDTDPDGDGLSVILATEPKNGTVTLDGDGTFTYTPAPNFNGGDTFTYLVSDGQGGTAIGTVTITVTAVDDPVQAVEITADAVEDGATATGNILTANNAANVDDEVLTVTPGSGVTANGGTWTIDADGEFTYTPAENFNGTDSFTYTISDGATSSTGVVTITVTAVNDPVVAVDDTNTVDEDGGPITGNVLTNDNAANVDAGEVLTVTPVSNLTTANGGTYSIAADGTYTYTPAENFNGTDNFTYTVSDGTYSDTGTITITIAAVNDAPVAGDDTVTTEEDTPYTGTLPISDADGDPLTIVVGTEPEYGALTIHEDGTFTYTPTTNFNGDDSFTYTVTDPDGETATGTITITVTAVDDPVSAVEVTADAVEDGGTVSGNVLTANNAANVDDEILTVTPDSGVTANGGTWTIDADGEFTYTPAENFNGTDNFTYTVSDGTYSDTGTITITVTPVNDAPVAGDDTVTTEEDTPYTGTLPISDADGDPLTIEVGTEPEYGALTIHEDGTFTYTPTANYNGDDSFTYTVTDGKGGTATGTITITVTPVNDDPTAEDDTFTFDEDHQIESSVTVHDVDGDSLTVTLDDPPSNGTLDLNADGTFTYTPNANYHGTDSFTYTVSDGKGGIATGTVTFNIQPVNDAPVAYNDNFTVPEEGTLQDSVIGNDIDVDGDSITVSLVDGPKNGTLTLNPDGSFTYVPNVDFYGTDTFTYEASDGELTSNTALVTIVVTNVNDAPVANDDSFTVDEDTELTMDVLANDVDADKDALTVVGVVSGPSSGTLTLNEDGTFTYTPDLNFNGTDTFTYEVSDGQGGTDTALVTISVTSVNDAPVAGTDTYTVNEDTVLTVPVGTGLLANDTDVDGGTLSATLTTEPAHGTVTVNTDGSFTYTPVANYNGTDSFTYTVSDGQGGTAVGTVNITVIAVNDAPVAVTDNYSVNEDTVLTVPAGTGLLANDTDVDGGALTVIANTNPAHGTLTLNPNGTFTYTPHENYNGADSFTYTVSDGQGGTAVGTVNITVNPVNDRPVAVNDSFNTDEDTPLNGNVLTNDIDVDGDTLSATLVMGPNNGTLTLNSNGTFTYTPNANFYGTDTFFYRVNDGTVNGQTAGVVTITVTPVNDPPVAANDSFTVAEDTTYSGNVLSNDSDVDGNPLTVISHTDPSHGTLNLNPNGTFTYTPHQDYHGTDSFTYTVSDGQGGTADATVDITVTPVNDRPVAVNDSFTTDEDTAVSGNVLTNDTDPDGNNTIQSAEVVIGPSNGTLTFNETTGEFTYTPGLNFNGTDSFTYTISDGSLTSEEATVTITVEPVNDPPVAVNDTIATNEDTQVTGNVLTNDTDPEGKATIVSAAVVTGPSNGTLTFNETTGEFTYTPNANFNGTDSFTYEITDNSGAVSNTATVTITVNPVNDPVVAINDTASGLEDGGPITGNVLINDIAQNVDIGETLTVTAANGVTVNGGVWSVSADGTFSYTPATNWNGTDSFKYTVSDGTTSAEGTVTITVTPVNDAPVANNDTAHTNPGQAVTIAVLANDIDVDSTTLTPVIVSQPVHGSVTVNANGTITYTPNGTYTGADSFTYKVNDGSDSNADSNVATVTITDNIAPIPVMVTATNKNGGTQGRIEPGDTITYTFSEPIDPGSILAGWDGSAQTVTVRVFDGDILLNLLGGQDTLQVYNAADNAQLTTLGTVKLDNAGYATSLLGGLLGAYLKYSNSTMVMSGNSVTITLGAVSPEGELLGLPLIGQGTVTSNATMTWVPGSGPKDLAGNPLGSTAAISETDNDRDF